MNVWVTHSAVIFLHSFSITLLLKQSVIIRRFIQSLLDDRSTTKLMNIFHQICFSKVEASRSLVSDLFSCCSYSICHNFNRMYEHSVASQVKRTVMIREHQLHFFLSVQSLLSHVYTESVLYKEILRTALSVFCERVASLHHSRSILLWILSLLKQ